MLNIVKQFDAEVLEDLARMIDEDIRDCVASRHRWMRSLVDISRNYLSINDESRALPWDDASDVFIPMTMISVETAHPRILSGVIGLDQTITATPTGGSSVQSADNVTKFLNWALHSHSQINAFPVLDRILHASETFGRMYSHIGWEKSIRNVTRRYTRSRYQVGAGAVLQIMKKVGVKKLLPKSLEVPYAQHLQDILGGRLVKVEPYMDNAAEGVTMYFDYYVNNRIRHGTAFIPTPAYRSTVIDLFLTVEELEKNAVSLTPVYHADIYHPMDELDLKSSSYVAERFWMDIEDLYALKQEGLAYFSDEVWSQITGETGDDDSFYTIDANVRASRRESRPSSDATSTEREFRDLYAKAYGDKESADGFEGIECIAYHRRIRLGGARRDYILYYAPAYRTIYRVVELGVEYPTGRRPYDAWEFMPTTDNSCRSLGIGHIIMDLQSIINDVFNKQMDRDDLLNMPFGFFRPTNFSKGQISKVSPGLLIPTNDPTAVNFPNWGRSNGADMPYIQALMGFVERLTSATNYFQGGAPSTANAPRTFGATAAIIQEGNINFDLHIRRYQNTLYSQALDIQGNYKHFMPTEMEFLAPGADTLTKISREDLEQEYGFVFKATASNTNPAVRREMAGFVYQALAMNPLIQSSVGAFYNVTRRFAIAHDYLEFDQDVPKPAPEQMHAPMTQEEEIAAMYHGQNFSPLPIDNHKEHLAYIQEFLATDMGAQVPTEVMTMLITHMQAHQNMFAMLQRAQQLTQNGGGVQPGLGQNPGMMNSEQADRQPQPSGGA